MHRPSRLARLFLMLLLPACFVVQARAADRPNIVFFLVDDLGFHDLAATGSPFYLTPHADRLIAEGISFTQAYAPHPRCVPSRYGLMTGRFPARGGVPGESYGLEADRVSVGQAMHEAGYATWFVGKWHLTEKDGSGRPDRRGFDVNIAGGAAGAPGSYSFPYNQKSNGRTKGEAKDIDGLEDGEDGEMLTDRLTAEADRLIREHEQRRPDQPFFLELAHYGVHTPFEDTKDRQQMFRQRLRKGVDHPDDSADDPEFLERDGLTKTRQDNEVYAAMIYRVDESLGRLVALLEELGIAEDTVIVLTSDHGGLSNRGLDNGRSLATSNLPLRAGKGHLLEGGIRVPLVVKWPGRIAPAAESGLVTVGTDLYPTFLALAGAEPRPEEHLDGRSILPALLGEAMPPRDAVYWHNPRPRPKSTGDLASSAIRLGDYKLIHWYPDDSNTLYNIREDPAERHDLAAEQPERVKHLWSQLEGWLREVDAPDARVRSNDDEDKDDDD